MRADRTGYIGITHGLPGIGKTRSARHYAQWDRVEALLPEQLFTLAGRSHSDGQFPHKPFASLVAPSFQEILSCRTVFYTAPVAASPGRIEREVMALCAALSYLVEAAEQASRGTDDFLLAYRIPDRTELVIVDEADRLKMTGLEQLRDLYDRGNFGLMLIGMRGTLKSGWHATHNCILVWDLCIPFRFSPKRKPDGFFNNVGTTLEERYEPRILPIRRRSVRLCVLLEEVFVSFIVC